MAGDRSKEVLLNEVSIVYILIWSFETHEVYSDLAHSVK